MTDDELNAIEQRANAATPGPWVDTDPRHIRHAEPNIYAGDYEVADVYDNNGCDDSSFIAHARQDIPALIAEIRRLRAALLQRTEQARDEVRG